MNDKERTIQALKFVKVKTEKDYLADLSVAMILVEMERRGIKFEKVEYGLSAMANDCEQDEGA